MMKRKKISPVAPTFLPALLLVMVLGWGGCENERLYEPFYPEDFYTITDYLEANSDSIGSYYALLQSLGLDRALSAYNPYGNNYTLFLPTDEAFEAFFTESEYADMNTLLADGSYARSLAKYHIVNTALETSDFPYGSLSDTTATGDFLTIAIDTATQQPRINGVAAVVTPNIEVINGFIHVIDHVLRPVTFPVGEWLAEQPEYALMHEVFALTGLLDTLTEGKGVTVLLETNAVLNEAGYTTLEDMITAYSPESTDYTSSENGLYIFGAYHILEGIYYLDDFEGQLANYNTKTSNPVMIDGQGLDIKINEGVGSLDTLFNGTDTTIIDYIGIDYEQSNQQAMNGAVHRVDHLLEVYMPPRSEVINQFHNEPLINAINNEAGETVFTDPGEFEVIDWTGTEALTYVNSDEDINGVWNNDYIILEGNFTMDYTIPKLLPGKYNLYLNAHALDDENASVNIAFDGVPIGGNIDLTSGGTGNNPYFNFLVGTVDLDAYVEHTISVSTLIPGVFQCDRFTFEPVQ